MVLLQVREQREEKGITRPELCANMDEKGVMLGRSRQGQVIVPRGLRRRPIKVEGE